MTIKKRKHQSLQKKITTQGLEIKHQPNHNVDFSAQKWAEKYVQNLQLDTNKDETNNTLNLTARVTQNQLYTVTSGVISAIRKKYTRVASRDIGFVELQFDFTSVALLEPILLWERYSCGVASPDGDATRTRSLVMAYFKVINDLLCLPLQRVAIAMSTVQKIIHHYTRIAQIIFWVGS